MQNYSNSFSMMCLKTQPWYFLKN